MRTKPMVAGAAFVFAALPLRAAARPAEAERPDLTGSWTLNEKESDDVREKMREAFEGRRGFGGPGGPMGGPGGGGRGRFGGPGGHRPGGGPAGPGSGSPRTDRLHGSRTLEIAQTDDEVAITDAEGAIRILRPDGRKAKRETERGTFEVKATWKDGRLVVEESMERGRTTESYELSSDGSRLVVHVTLERRPMPQVRFRRVYDRRPVSGAEGGRTSRRAETAGPGG